MLKKSNALNGCDSDGKYPQAMPKEVDNHHSMTTDEVFFKPLRAPLSSDV
jgi:hypothetical protein